MPNSTRPLPDGSEPADLVQLLHLVATETDHYREAVGAHHRVHRTDLSALSVIMRAVREGVPLTPRRLGEALRLSPPATTALLDRLERAGHIERHREPGDRRLVHLAATDTAHTTGRRMFGPLARHIEEAARAYPPAERAVIAAFLRDVTEATVAARDEATES
ncbi:MarR family winged helix-turn-helix transcriptional regulator [Actinocorallia sp. A-T 12471]|uniref:MarR family winged helix-turn-helix transcriptional regulator n=1 Tax=Actinocorallia sp. A-T 12471 TaxID=3089813 RepID=UPI0029CEAB39|nr:MarR family transcriptional regulator [Actinocorallia sp. A-T 12471]MDX6740347.1 MarR family transcriptional regulator [Actinocorallia sp. A-T 12471]